MEKETDIYIHHVFMQSPVAIMILRGKDYRVEFANDLYLQLVEKGKSFIGKPIFESLPELQTQGIQALLEGVLETGIPYHGKELEVYLFRNHRREQCFFNFVYQPIRDLEGAISGITVVATEVTEQVLARQRIEVMFNKVVAESEKKYRLMADLMPAKVSNGDAQGRVF